MRERELSRVTKRELVEEVWRNSTLTWREADRVISKAMDLGKYQGYITIGLLEPQSWDEAA